MVIVILGGGISGLYAAYKLMGKEKIILIEKSSKLGGLCRTEKFSNGYCDIGGHKILFNSKKYFQLLKDIGVNVDLHNRKSKIYFNDKYINYPIVFKEILFNFSFVKNLNFFLSFIYSRIKIRKSKNLEEWLIKYYGKNLYEIYFKEYSEKMWGVNCKNISKEWALKRIGKTNLFWDFFSNFFKGQKTKENETTFFYPRNGIGDIADSFERILKGNVSIFKNSVPLKVVHKKGKIISVKILKKGKPFEIKCSRLINTIPIPDFISYFSPKPERNVLETASYLEYRGLSIFFFESDKPFSKEHWIYFHQKKFPFTRIHEPKNWNKNMVQKGNIICIEVPGNVDVIKTKFEIKKSFEDLGFSNMKFLKSIYEPFAYPFHSINSKKVLPLLYNYMNSFSNLIFVGRQGRHKYFDIEEILEDVDKKL